MPDKVQVTMPSDREVRVVRKFKAPRALVWDAHTKPELITKWMLGPPGWSMPVCEMDVRVGGAYRWRWRNEADGKEFGFFGDFTEVAAPSKLAHTQTYDPGDVGGSMDDGEPSIISTVFTEADGFTTLTLTMLFTSKALRDAAVSTGMTDGMEIGYARLDDMFSKQDA